MRSIVRRIRKHFVLLGAALGCALVSCVSPAPHAQPPVADAAQAAFARARRLHAEGTRADAGELWEELRLAQELAPQWVAPARLEDDLLIAELRSVEALERRRFAVQGDPANANSHYLAARLTRTGDPGVYQKIVQLDPQFAWGHHAFAVTHASRGPEAVTEAAWQRAIRLARSSWERAFFGVRLAEFLFSQRSPAAAREFLLSFLEDWTLRPADRAWVASVLARTELRSGLGPMTRVGYSRGLRLLEGGQLTEVFYGELALAMISNTSVDDSNRIRLEDLLLATDTETSLAVLATSWNSRGKWGRIQALAKRKQNANLLGLLDRGETLSGHMRAGSYVDAMELWLAGLPEQVLADDGLPKDEKLRAMVRAAHAAQAAGGSLDSLCKLTTALCDAGWFREAEWVAEQVLENDFDLGQPLVSRAMRGVALFQRLRSLLGDVESGSTEIELQAQNPQAPAGANGSLKDLLGRFGLAFDQAQRLPHELPGKTNHREELMASPRVTYGPAATLIHPGPNFSLADERAGRGKRGAAVPGLASLMQSYGRFAVMGEALGTGADGVVLQRVLVEERHGEHLGVPWSGTIAWCDGVDVRSRAQRADGGVAGAAVHEGYWIDLEQLRDSFASWGAGLAAFQGDPLDENAQTRLERAIDTAGLKLRTPPSNERGRRRERIAVSPALDSARRLRLTLLRERAGPTELLGKITFREIVELTATHEEGHLCDQTRFFPWQQNLGLLFSFALDQAFSPSAIRERLEYRAELVALCAIPDPRLSLVHLLAAAEVDGDLSGLGHAPAYRSLLADFLEALDADLQAFPENWPELSNDHMLVHQLHLLPPEKVRAVGQRLAQLEGLVDKTFRPAPVGQGL